MLTRSSGVSTNTMVNFFLWPLYILKAIISAIFNIFYILFSSMILSILIPVAIMAIIIYLIYRYSQPKRERYTELPYSSDVNITLEENLQKAKDSLILMPEQNITLTSDDGMDLSEEWRKRNSVIDTMMEENAERTIM